MMNKYEYMYNDVGNVSACHFTTCWNVSEE